ncbi:MAG: 2-dehydropantoate 2-reductase [Nevskiaceae bacterium]
MICVFGAGSIGCYVGGRLAAAGGAVTFVGRPRLAAEIRAHGLHLTDWRGADQRVPVGQVRFETDAAAARDADLVLVTVKSAGTAEAGRELAAVLKPGAIVVSFQNGLHNDEVLRTQLPGATVLTGMVPFNVVNRGAGAFHQGSEGALEAQADGRLAPFLPAFAAAGLPLALHQDMRAVQWGKLQLNLNNAINALSGVPLKEELSQRAFRQCLALAQRELLRLLDAAGIRPAKLTPLPPHLLPKMLAVPDAMFRLLASRMLAIDPLARSSMWEDLQAGRATEIDYLNGEVVKLAASLGRSAPVNGKLVALILEAEKGGRRDWSGPELLKELQSAK